jgi:hypothetical protein
MTIELTVAELADVTEAALAIKEAGSGRHHRSFILKSFGLTYSMVRARIEEVG